MGSWAKQLRRLGAMMNRQHYHRLSMHSDTETHREVRRPRGATMLSVRGGHDFGSDTAL
jgi:hypothetical protein